MGADGGRSQERTAPLDASAPHMCLKMKPYTLLFLRLSAWASLTARLRSEATFVADGPIRENLGRCSRSIPENKRIYVLVKSEQTPRTEVVSYLHAVLYWPLEDGCRGDAGAGMRSDARDRDMKRSLLWLTQTDGNQRQ